MARQSPDISHDMQKVYRRFERWRSTHTGRVPIPMWLWSAAVELAREYGGSTTAQALRLEYGKLKRLLESSIRAAPHHGQGGPAIRDTRRKAGAGHNSHRCG